LVFIYSVVLFLGSFFVCSGFYLKTICKGSRKEKMIALTFDDGPGEHTREILDFLGKNEIKAAFFCIGSKCGNQNMLQEIHQKGHIIGNHSWSHSNTIDFSGKKKWIEEITKTDEAIQKITGAKPRYFRPPYGVTTPKLGQALKHTGHLAIGWKIRSLDTVNSKTSDTIWNNIKSKIEPGSILLFHDTKEKCLPVLEELAAFCKANDYKVVSLDTLLNQPAYA
jgi:peptidoglycan/xylan/chitin deacetylase (PgdA/CDA1 family)